MPEMYVENKYVFNEALKLAFKTSFLNVLFDNLHTIGNITCAYLIFVSVSEIVTSLYVTISNYSQMSTRKQETDVFFFFYQSQ